MPNTLEGMCRTQDQLDEVASFRLDLILASYMDTHDCTWDELRGQWDEQHQDDEDKDE